MKLAFLFVATAGTAGLIVVSGPNPVNVTAQCIWSTLFILELTKLKLVDHG